MWNINEHTEDTLQCLNHLRQDHSQSKDRQSIVDVIHRNGDTNFNVDYQFLKWELFMARKKIASNQWVVG